MPIRSAQPGDLDSIMALTAVSFGDAAWSRRMMEEVVATACERPWLQMARIWEDMPPPLTETPGAAGLAATATGHASLAGYLIAQIIGRDAEIQSLAIWPQRRRRGLGSALLADFMELARERQWQRIFLEVRAGNTAAQQFYARHGFEAYGRRGRYYHSPVEDALLMRRAI